MDEEQIRKQFEEDMRKNQCEARLLARFTEQHAVAELRGLYCRTTVESMWQGYLLRALRFKDN